MTTIDAFNLTHAHLIPSRIQSNSKTKPYFKPLSIKMSISSYHIVSIIPALAQLSAGPENAGGRGPKSQAIEPTSIRENHLINGNIATVSQPKGYELFSVLVYKLVVVLSPD